MPVVLGLRGGKSHGEGGRKRKRTRKRKEQGSARRVDMDETQMWRIYVVNVTCATHGRYKKLKQKVMYVAGVGAQRARVVQEIRRIRLPVRESNIKAS
jgi:hypothetical protein